MRKPARATVEEMNGLLSEAAVLERYPMLSAHGLKKARKEGIIAWMPGRWKSAWYRASAVEEFLTRTEKPCLAPAPPQSLNSEGSGSPKTQAPPSFTDSGLSPELVEHAARHFAQRI